MTDKEAMKLALEAGIRDCTCNGTLGCLERFASLVRADEREKCAQLATTIAEQDLPEEMPEGEELLQAVRQIAIGVLIAKAIRARTNK